MKNRLLRQRWLDTLVLLLCGTSLFGQFPQRGKLCGEPLVLHFRFDRSLVDYGYKENARTLSVFDELFSDTATTSLIDSITIVACSSPDGDRIYNSRLAYQRAVAVKGYLVWKYPHFDQKRIITFSRGENWEGLYQLIAEDPAVPDRDEVLQILGEVEDRERCKLLLKKLNKGEAYDHIQKKLLPQLRNATVCHFWMKKAEHSFVPGDVKNEKAVWNNRLAVAPRQDRTGETLTTWRMGETGETRTTFRPALALRTNLLSWAGLTSDGDLAAFRPNLSAELFFARRWSVAGSAEYSYWQGGKGDKFRGISGYSIEPRVWLSGADTYRWLYLGAYAASGDFDYRPQPAGDSAPIGASVTGTYWSTGISLGVYLPLTPHWGVEAGLRGGYRKSSGKAYDYEPPHAYYHHDAPSVRWGITGLNISFTYRWLTK